MYYHTLTNERESVAYPGIWTYNHDGAWGAYALMPTNDLHAMEDIEITCLALSGTPSAWLVARNDVRLPNVAID